MPRECFLPGTTYPRSTDSKWHYGGEINLGKLEVKVAGEIQEKQVKESGPIIIIVFFWKCMSRWKQHGLNLIFGCITVKVTLFTSWGHFVMTGRHRRMMAELLDRSRQSGENSPVYSETLVRNSCFQIQLLFLYFRMLAPSRSNHF